MRYIINSTRAFNRQLCTLGNSNGIALNIRQLIAIQVKRNDLICRNRNILGVIIIQSNGSTIFRLVNLPCRVLAGAASLEPVPSVGSTSSAANATGAMVSTIITARKADNNLLFMFILLKIIFPAKAVPFRLSFAKFVLRKVLCLRASTSDTRVPLCHFICLPTSYHCFTFLQ